MNAHTPPIPPAHPLPTDLRAAFTALGWQKDKDQFREDADMFWRRVPTPTPSRQNREKEGVVVAVYISDFFGVQNAEMELVGELPDGSWIKLMNYLLPKTAEGILAVIPRMLATWECAVNYPVDCSVGEAR